MEIEFSPVKRGFPAGEYVINAYEADSGDWLGQQRFFGYESEEEVKAIAVELIHREGGLGIMAGTIREVRA